MGQNVKKANINEISLIGKYNKFTSIFLIFLSFRKIERIATENKYIPINKGFENTKEKIVDNNKTIKV